MEIKDFLDIFVDTKAKEYRLIFNEMSKRKSSEEIRKLLKVENKIKKKKKVVI